MRLPWSPRRGLSVHPPRRRAGSESHQERETVQSPAPPRLSSAEVTALRVRALQGDPLREVRNATREWVLRSLLIGKHLEEWAALAGISEPREIEHARQRVRRWYQQRLESYQRACQ